MSSPIRVVIVEDSRVAQAILRAALEAEADIEVVGTACDAQEARERIKALQPDVITLDVALPGMSGLAFLSNLMRLRPMPAIVVSMYGREGDEVARKALELGALAVLEKPVPLSGGDLAEMAARLRACVRAAASVDAATLRRLSVRLRETRPDMTRLLPIVEGTVVALGASMGGVDALQAIVGRLPLVFPPIVVVQHMSVDFVEPFARRLGQRSGRPLHVVRGTVPLQQGHIYMACGNEHVVVDRRGVGLSARSWRGDKVQGHRPSVDVLFTSVALAAGRKAVGVLLTGMGVDGAAGLREMRAAGGATIAQDARSSVVWGMPGEAVRQGAAQYVEPLDAIADKLVSLVRGVTQ